MNRTFSWLVLSGVVFFGGCSPKEPAAPAVQVVDEEALQREQLFGPEAKASDITWRISGLGIRMLAEGEGVAPKMNDTVRVHYVGRLKDGSVFDDSRARGKPSDFVVKQLITGWASAMQVVKPGGRAVFFIPPSLGYGGVKVAGIPPSSGLIFEVELIAVNPEASPRL